MLRAVIRIDNRHLQIAVKIIPALTLLRPTKRFRVRGGLCRVIIEALI